MEQFFAKRKIFALMLCAVLILGAGISAARISCGDTQSTDKHGALTLSIRYPGQNAERIERMIVMPIEEALSRAGGAEHITSLSKDSEAKFYITGFDQKRIKYMSAAVREAIDPVIAAFPREVNEPELYGGMGEEKPCLIISLVPKKNSSQAELCAAAENVYKPAVERSEGVSEVDVSGGVRREMLVTADAAALHAMGISYQEIFEAVHQNSLALPAGNLRGAKEESVRISGRAQTVRDVTSSPLIIGENKTPLSLGAFVEVHDFAGTAETYARRNGRDEVALYVMKNGSASMLSVSKNVRASLKALTHTTAEPVIVFDAADEVMHAIRRAAVCFVLSIFLCAGYVYVKSGSLKVFIHGAACAAVSLSCVMIIMYFAHIPLSVPVMFTASLVAAYAIFCGMHTSEKHSLIQNALVFCAASCYFLTGDKTLMRDLSFLFCAGTISASVSSPMVSVLVSSLARTESKRNPFYFTKMFRDKILSYNKIEKAISTYRVVKKLYDSLRAEITGFIKKLILRINPKKMILYAACSAMILYALFVCGIFFTTGKTASSAPAKEIFCAVECASGTTLDATSRIVRDVEACFVKSRFVQDVSSRITASRGDMTITLKDNADAAHTIAVLKAGSRDIQNAFLFFETGDNTRVRQSLDIEITGDDIAHIRSNARLIAQKLGGLPVTDEVVYRFRDGNPGVRIEVDRAKSSVLGLDAAVIGETLHAIFFGGVAAKIIDHGEYDIRCRISREPVQLAGLSQITIRNSKGKAVPLAECAQLVPSNEITSIWHKDRSRMETITVTAKSESPSFDAQVQQVLASISLSHNCHARIADTESREKAKRSLLAGLFLSLVLIAMFAAAFSESITPVKIIFFLAPFVWCGAFSACVVFAHGMSAASFAAVLLLTACAANADSMTVRAFVYALVPWTLVCYGTFAFDFACAFYGGTLFLYIAFCTAALLTKSVDTSGLCVKALSIQKRTEKRRGNFKKNERINR